LQRDIDLTCYETTFLFCIFLDCHPILASCQGSQGTFKRSSG
jgi:hypothetical protein